MKKSITVSCRRLYGPWWNSRIYFSFRPKPYLTSSKSVRMKCADTKIINAFILCTRCKKKTNTIVLLLQLTQSGTFSVFIKLLNFVTYCVKLNRPDVNECDVITRWLSVIYTACSKNTIYHSYPRRVFLASILYIHHKSDRCYGSSRRKIWFISIPPAARERSIILACNINISITLSQIPGRKLAE